MTMIIFEFIYLLIVILGFVLVDATNIANLLGFIEINSADNYLHTVLALIFIGAGFATKSKSSM